VCATVVGEEDSFTPARSVPYANVNENGFFSDYLPVLFLIRVFVIVMNFSVLFTEPVR
jgi:hypothetical protein